MNASGTKTPRSWRLAAGVAALALGALAVAGCTNAQLVDVWQDPDFQGHHLRAVMVVSRQKDPTIRRVWEDAVRARLTKGGVDAMASYQKFPDAPPTQQQVKDALADNDLDAAIVLKPLASEVDTHVVPGWTSVQARGYYDPWGDREAVVYRPRYHRGYVYRERYARESVTVWAARANGDMIWAGTVLVPMDRSEGRIADQLASGVVPEMKKARLI